MIRPATFAASFAEKSRPDDRPTYRAFAAISVSYTTRRKA